ncbi:hypothetical protein [Klebsiella pneumoniae IS22]|nr:hypothetical protein [Klebsiella pneumoniae IS22]
MRQKGILLAFIKAMHFVNKQDGSPAALRFCRARSIASRISFTPEVTAEIRSTSALA